MTSFSTFSFGFLGDLLWIEFLLFKLIDSIVSLLLMIIL